MEQAKKESILAAATKAFARLGFKKASVDEIAREAGVAKGTVYLACDSKEDLFYQAVHREVRGCVAEVAKIIDPRVPADQLLGEMVLRVAFYVDEHPLVRDLFFGLYHGLLPGWAGRLDELRALGGANAVELLRLGIRQGVFRADLDVEETATLLQDLQIAGLMLHARRTSSKAEQLERLRRRSEAGLTLVLDGLRVREPSGPHGKPGRDAPHR